MKGPWDRYSEFCSPNLWAIKTYFIRKHFGATSFRIHCAVEWAYDTAIYWLGIYPEELEAGTYGYLHKAAPMSMIHNGQEMKPMQAPMDWWMDKENEIHACSGIWCHLEKKGYSVPAAKWMDLESMRLSDSRTNPMWFHIYGVPWEVTPIDRK